VLAPDEDAVAQYKNGAWTAMPSSQKEKRRSWAMAAGRSSGKEGYKFGDVTRTFVGAVRGRSGRDWRAAGRRSTGGEGYKFGDLTRVAVSNLFGDKHKKHTMPRPEPLLCSTAELHQNGAGTQGSLLDGVWVVFFNAAYAVGRLALLAGELTIDEVESLEPSVLLGLPALAMLECAIRSAAVAKDDKLITFDGKKVGLAAIRALGSFDSALFVGRRREAAAEALGVFVDLVALSSHVGGCRLSTAGLVSLRARALAADGEAGARLAPDEDREVNRLVALAQALGIGMSRIELYKHSFGRVLRALGEEQRHEDDMLKMMEDQVPSSRMTV